MTTIYHNPRCRKSRETLHLLEERNESVNTVLYLDDPPTVKELKNILNMLGMKPIELVRKNEAIWKENFKNKDLSDDDILKAMRNHPKLIERPIVLKNGKAALGRPPENVINIL
ncbi:MAG: arsenate reductase (glutaredoxin) [Bacteroidia bacterium]|nr:arsenate reductase (glutaredoxin) [Bacteroidia bacterium]NNF31353.1 arsenate reductase (glutaredoxin) [Flavobacteriaceae bacterium]MBT8276571.1 arsenate reductase (glutaredoxin) [Bacteroidia bacterium]NNJ82865.1 arsenate reductase (glutaredoxin) [Flavobacteriaceae bacterium]NNK54373.1 arsenate reductase (glutaredoxin) [Flavobacteriaceae bacterium]